MEQRDRAIIKKFKKDIPFIIKKRFKKIMAYGSRVRGQHHEFSDLDIAIVIDKKDLKTEEILDEIAYNVMFSYDFKPIISLKVFSEKKFNQALKAGFSFYRTLVREGVIV